MECLAERPVTLNQFALVSYIPDPLGEFLDDLRLRLVPGCSPRAHVTVLPPRPIQAPADVASQQLRENAENFPSFEVRLGDVEVFPASKVVYLSVAKGEEDLRVMYQALNRGSVAYQEPFPYHPHITLAQNFPPEEVERLHDIAARLWASYRGPRSFLVDTVEFVQNTSTCWKDLARIDLK